MTRSSQFREDSRVSTKNPARRPGRPKEKRPAIPVFSLLAPHLHDLETCCVIEQGPMNKQEAEYAQTLEARRIGGEIIWWAFDAIKVRLANATWYSPDFFVLLADGRVEFHEFKGGHWEDDARVKIKTAAGMYPFFRFIAVQKRLKRDGGGYTIEHFKAHHRLVLREGDRWSRPRVG